LTGIRALVALFAGVGRVSARRMLFFSLISTLTFNFILLYLALRLRQDYHKIEPLFRAYNGIIIAILLIILVVLLVRYFLNRRRTPTP
jgi:membrane protein DedA with SNARE-associated domain